MDLHNWIIWYRSTRRTQWKGVGPDLQILGGTKLKNAVDTELWVTTRNQPLVYVGRLDLWISFKTNSPLWTFLLDASRPSRGHVYARQRQVQPKMELLVDTTTNYNWSMESISKLLGSLSYKICIFFIVEDWNRLDSRGVIFLGTKLQYDQAYPSAADIQNGWEGFLFT